MRRKPHGEGMHVEAFPLPYREPVLEHPWHAAIDDADAAYRRWAEAPAWDRGDAFAAYRAAEDREAAAADDLRLELERS